MTASAFNVIPAKSDAAFQYLQEAQRRGVPEVVLVEAYRKLVGDDLAMLKGRGLLPPSPRFCLRGFIDFEVTLDPIASGVRIRATRRDLQGNNRGQEAQDMPLPDAWRHPDEGCYDQLRCLGAYPEGEAARKAPPERIREAGKQIGQWLAAGGIRDLFKLSLNDAGDEYGVRLRLQIHPQLGNLPWEATLFDGNHLCLRENVPIVRHSIAPDPVRPLRVDGPLRILVVRSQPIDLAPLNLEREFEDLEARMAGLVEPRSVQLVPLPCQPGQSQRQALAAVNGTFHVFHFMGHGRIDPGGEGQLALMDADGRAEFVSAMELTEILVNARVRLVFLNACETGIDCGPGSLPDALIRAGALCVLAMRRRIGDTAAINLAKSFYRWVVVERYPVEAALSRVRLELKADNTLRPWEWVTPVLYSRASDGLLFEFPQLP
jgi:hypothetical protein